MATKSANVMARVEPDVKEQAESILNQLGVPTSVLINILYKQIIMTKSIPFALSIPTAPIARDEMSDDEFDAVMRRGLQQAKENRAAPVAKVFTQLRRDL